MAKKCYKQFKNGKWYTESQIRDLHKLSEKMKLGEDVSQKARDILSQGLDELPGEVVENTLKEGRFTRAELKKDYERIGMVFNYSSGESISVGEAIEIAAEKGYISDESKGEFGFPREFDIASKALSETNSGLDAFELVALQRAIAITRDKIYSTQQLLDEMVAAGQSTTELNEMLERQKGIYDLFAYAYSMNTTDRARGMAYILHMNALLFDPVKEMGRIKAAFPEATEKQLKEFEDTIKKIDEKKKKLLNTELDVENNKQKATEAAAKAGFKKVVEEAKQKEPKKEVEPKVKTFFSEVYNKAKKDPLGTFKEMFAGAFKSKVKFQDGDTDTVASAEDYERTKAEVILTLSKHFIRTEGIKDLPTLIKRVMDEYNSLENVQEELSENDIINAFALKSVNESKSTDYEKALAEIRATAKKIIDLKKLLEGEMKPKKPARPEKSPMYKKIQGLITDLQRVQYIGVDGAMNPREQEDMFTNLEAISEAYRLINNTASEEVIKQKTAEIAERLARLNSQKVEDRLAQRLEDLKQGRLVDSRKNYIKPFLTKEAFVLKEEIEELRRKLKNQEIEAAIAKEFEKYSDKKVLGVSLRSFMKKKRAFSDIKTFWNLASRYHLGGDLGTLLLHGGYDTFAIVGKAAGYQWATKSGRKEAKSNLKGLANFWMSSISNFYTGVSEIDGRKTILQEYEQMTHNPTAVLARQLGLAIVRPFSTELITSKDDFFMGKGISDLLEGNTLLTKGAKILFNKFDTASEGSYVMGLNTLRLSLFTTYMNTNPNASPEELKAIAREINISTGKGAMTKSVEGLSVLFTAPKLYYSRIQLLLGTPKHLLNLSSSDPIKRAVAKRRIGNNMAFIAGHTAVMLLAGMAGWEWETDPRSSNFLKLVKGDSSMDLTAGFGKWISMLFAAPAVYIDHYNSGGQKIEAIWGPPDVGEEFSQISDRPTTFALKRLYYLAHGSLQALWGIRIGENAIGQPYGTDIPSSVYGWLVNHYSPMALSELIEPAKVVDDESKERRGFFEAANEHFLQVIGTGFMSYDNNLKHSLVVDYLSNLTYFDKKSKTTKTGVEPKNLFDSQGIDKILPEVGEPGSFNFSRKKQFKSELDNVVGTKILENINENGEGTYSKEELKSLYMAEAKRLAKLYREEFY